MGIIDRIKGALGNETIPRTQVDALLKEGATLLDVRSPAEFATGSIAGAINIPVQELAGRLGELRKDRVVVAYCRSGMRSGSAANTLRASGFEAHNAGGIASLK